MASATVIAGGEAARKSRKAKKAAKKEESRSRFCKGGFVYDSRSKSCVPVEKEFKKHAREKKREEREKPPKKKRIPPRKRVVTARF